MATPEEIEHYSISPTSLPGLRLVETEDGQPEEAVTISEFHLQPEIVLAAMRHDDQLRAAAADTPKPEHLRTLQAKVGRGVPLEAALIGIPGVERQVRPDYPS